MVDIIDELYPLKEECYEVIGCCMDTHNELGCGFLESVYQEALSLEFSRKNIPYEKEKILDITYKGKTLNKKFIADFVCYNELIVELKAVDHIANEHENYVIECV